MRISQQKGRTFRRWSLSIGLAALAGCIAAGRGLAAEAVLSLDAKRRLINKDVADERWAITQNLDDGSVTGNVFFPGGGEPRFVWCEDVSADEDRENAMFSCYGADRCPASPCGEDQWSFLSEVTLPRSFFRPVGDIEWNVLEPPVTLPISFFAPPAAPAAATAGTFGGTRESGVQVSLDGKRVLISKDVGAERWAITRNLDDATVTGNVFFSDDREPAFLWCEELSRAGDEATFQCSIAEPTVFGPIPDVDGNFFVNPLTGDDANPGTQAAPFATINGALEAMPDAGGDLYVAGGVYLETVLLRSRVGVFGSFDPSTWIRDRESFPSIVRGELAPAVTFGLGAARGGAVTPVGVLGFDIAAVTFDGFTIEVPDAPPNHSSFGLVFEEATVVAVSRCTILVGSGGRGSDGGDGEPGANGGNGGAGPDAHVCFDPSPGGTSGAAPGSLDADGGDGGEILALAVGVFAGEPGRAGHGSDPGNGGAGGSGDGGNGEPGGAGADGADGSGGGPFRRGGFAQEGAAGSGGGGGGGGGSVWIPPVPPFCGGGGGGGGAGAAGGGAGGPGGDGGSSVGLYLVESDVDVSDDLIVTGNGKDGGRGGLGAASGLGGGGGRGGARFGAQGAGGSGGRGGDGGHGGDAGSGGGGGSVGILLDGSVAILSGNTFEIGAAGRGGWNEAADPSTRGSDGVRAELHSFDELDRQSASD